MTQLVRVFVALFFAVVATAVQGCENPNTPCVEQRQDSAQQLAVLQREKDNTLYELQLRQDEVDRMVAGTHAPGVVGVSDQWLGRKNELVEKITQLKIKVHDLDLQIAALSPDSNR